MSISPVPTIGVDTSMSLDLAAINSTLLGPIVVVALLEPLSVRSLFAAALTVWSPVKVSALLN